MAGEKKAPVLWLVELKGITEPLPKKKAGRKEKKGERRKKMQNKPQCFFLLVELKGIGALARQRRQNPLDSRASMASATPG